MQSLTKDQPITTRSILRRYMADYSNATSVTSKVKSGFYAIHLVDQDKVWLGETNNFQNILKQVSSKSNMADCVMKVRDAGGPLTVWFLTQPDRFSAQQLEDELWQHDRLAYRKEHDFDKPGNLYCIRHKRTGSYFVQTDRTGTEPTTLLGKFLDRLQSNGTGNYNPVMAQFITDNAGDILRGTGFEIKPISTFTTKEDERAKKLKYIGENANDINLNLHVA